MADPLPRPQDPPQARWFWQRRLQYRLMLAFGSIFLVTLALLMAYVLTVVYESQLEQAEHDLELEAFLIANALEDPLSGYTVEFEDAESHRDDQEHDEGDDDEGEDDEHGSGRSGASAGLDTAAAIARVAQTPTRVQQLAEWFADDAEGRVTILDANGTAIADSHYAPEQVASQRDRPEVEAALRLAEEHDIRTDELSGEQALFAAAPIQMGSSVLGVVRLAVPMSSVLEPIRNMFINLIGAGVGATVLVTILAIWISRYLVRPLTSLEESTHAVGEGDFSQRARVMTADEIGTLAVAFNTMVARLQRLVQGQRLFIANASHELRTPLTNIKLRSEALIDLAKNGASEQDIALRQRYIEEIDSEADRLSRLANTLLDLSRMDSLGRKPATEGVDLAPLLHSMAQSTRLRVEQAGLTLRVDVPEDLPTVRVWPDQLETIVNNLLDNAIEYTPAGGLITLSARATETGCRMSVADTGAGIPAADLPHIFEQFYRVDKARSRQETRAGVGSGAGLGLSLARILVERNGGSIEVETEIEQGTTFTVDFPTSRSSGSRLGTAEHTKADAKLQVFVQPDERM